jgi:hypothetical protein
MIVVRSVERQGQRSRQHDGVHGQADIPGVPAPRSEPAARSTAWPEPNRERRRLLGENRGGGDHRGIDVVGIQSAPRGEREADGAGGVRHFRGADLAARPAQGDREFRRGLRGRQTTKRRACTGQPHIASHGKSST